MSDYKAKAIILASGPGDVTDRDAVIEIISTTLTPFQHAVLEKQSIALSGRVIIAMEIGLDPAHARAIETDLSSSLKRVNFDLALEIL